MKISGRLLTVKGFLKVASQWNRRRAVVKSCGMKTLNLLFGCIITTRLVQRGAMQTSLMLGKKGIWGASVMSGIESKDSTFLLIFSSCQIKFQFEINFAIFHFNIIDKFFPPFIDLRKILSTPFQPASIISQMIYSTPSPTFSSSPKPTTKKHFVDSEILKTLSSNHQFIFLIHLEKVA